MVIMTTTEELINISPKHKTFLDAYFSNGRKAYEAYREVYTKSSEASAKTECYKILRKLQKSSYFLHKTEEIKKKADQKYGVSRDWLIMQNKFIYESAMAGDQIPTGTGFYLKIDRASAVKAIDQLTKMLGEYADTKIKLAGTMDHDVNIVLNIAKSDKKKVD